MNFLIIVVAGVVAIGGAIFLSVKSTDKVAKNLGFK